MQQLLGQPGLRWGTLQALDTHSMQRVIEWLSQATLPAQRQKRLRALKRLLQESVSTLMRPYVAPLTQEPGAGRAQAEKWSERCKAVPLVMVNCLRGFCPVKRAFETLLTVHQPREEQVNGLFNDVIDLFAEETQENPGALQTKDKARLAHNVVG